MNPASSADARVSLRARFRTATREAILDAAAALMGAEGASQTRMDDIAARAGVAVGTVYNYFEDRTALVLALLETRSRTLMDALESAGEAPRGRAGASAASSFEAQLEQFVATLAAHFEANRFLLGVLLEDEQLRGVDAKSATRRTAMRREMMVRAERLIDRGIRAKALRKDSPTVYAALLLGMVRGAALASLTGAGGLSGNWTASVVRMFLHGAVR